MAWSHPDIALEDLMRLIKGFVDILILASGFLSSGLPATWNAENIKKAIRWGVFFENAFNHLKESDGYEALAKELDARLFELTSDSSFPEGLRCLSSETLSRAREIVLEFFSQSIYVSVRHVYALLNAVVAVDLEDFAASDVDDIDLYVEKLMGVKLHGAGNSDSAKTDAKFLNLKTKHQNVADNSSFTIQELCKRQASVSRLSLCESSLACLLKLVSGNVFSSSGMNLLQEQPNDALSFVEVEDGFLQWNHWKEKHLSYLLNKRTIALISGANLVFNAPKVQWIQIFEALKSSTDVHADALLEIVEMSLLGLTSSRWANLVHHLMSSSCDLVPVSGQYFSVLNLLKGRSKPFSSDGKILSSKEDDILDYITGLLDLQPSRIWEIPPVLVGAALPSWILYVCSNWLFDVVTILWTEDGNFEFDGHLKEKFVSADGIHLFLWSNLFGSYLYEIERGLKGETEPSRCCSCHPGKMEHKDCELAERLWCLYVFHIQGSHLMLGKYDAGRPFAAN